jgi:hypothetical protein
MTHFRTLLAVVEVEDDSELQYPGVAVNRAHDALEAAGFTVVTIRNEHNEDGDLPPASMEVPR